MICFDVFKVILARFFCFFTVYFDRNFDWKWWTIPDGVSETAYGDSRFPLSLIILITHLFSCLHIKLCLLLWLNLGNWHVSNMKGALLLVSLSLLPPHSNLHLFWPNYRILLLLQFPEICLQFVSSFVSKRGHCKIHYDELPLRYWATQFAVHYFEFCIFHFPRKNISQMFGYSKATWRRQHFQKHLQHHNIKPTSTLPVRHRTTTQRIEGGNAFIAKINKCCSAFDVSG